MIRPVAPSRPPRAAARRERPGRGAAERRRLDKHQARGADKIIANSVDAHVEAERKRKEADDDDGAAGALAPVG